MIIRKSTQQYETWLQARMPVLAADLDFKHQRMKESAFSFLRATFYRWAQAFPELCDDLMAAPLVLGVGDLHVENFGTWRDTEGRLIWGINDFDEACRIPYTLDLTRLATSAHLALEAHALDVSADEVCKEIFVGYCESLERGGRPFVLSEHNSILRDLAQERLKDPARFWNTLLSLPNVEIVPADVRKALERMLPEGVCHVQFKLRRSGLGSLGRRRIVALGTWCGGCVAREAKELTCSAWEWAWPPRGKSAGIAYEEVFQKAIRCLDPCTKLKGNWIVRRLAPDCSRIELASLSTKRDTAKLLRAMGAETANIHLGSQDPKLLQADLKFRGRARPDHEWLHKAALKMADLVRDEWREWSKSE